METEVKGLKELKKEAVGCGLDYEVVFVSVYITSYSLVCAPLLWTLAVGVPLSSAHFRAHSGVTLPGSEATHKAQGHGWLLHTLVFLTLK